MFRKTTAKNLLVINFQAQFCKWVEDASLLPRDTIFHFDTLHARAEWITQHFLAVCHKVTSFLLLLLYILLRGEGREVRKYTTHQQEKLSSLTEICAHFALSPTEISL